SRQSEVLAQAGELCIVTHSQNHVAVRDRKNLVGHDVGVGISHATGRLTGDHIVERLIGQYANHRVQQRHVDPLSGAVPLTLPEGCEYSDYRVGASKYVGEGDAGLLGRSVGLTREVHYPAHPLDHEVIPGAGCIRSGLSKPGNGTVDESRIEAAEARIV